MLRRKLTAAVTLFICLCISTNIVFAAKSVFFLASQSYSYVEAYLIDGNSITYQAEAQIRVADLPDPYSWGCIANSVWPGKKLMFITYDGSSRIAIVRTTNLEKLSEFDTGCPRGAVNNGLAGIAVDTGKGKIYVVERQSPNLRVYSWSDSARTLVHDSNHVLAGIGEHPYGALGIALDETNGLLYVSDGTVTIRYYNTTTWQSAGTFTIPHEAAGMAVDPNPARGYLYTGHIYDHTYLVRTSLTSHTSTEIDVRAPVIGIAVDMDTGLVYCSTYNNDYRVYDSNLTLLDTIEDPFSGPTGVAVGGLYKPSLFHLAKEIIDANNYYIFGDKITYTITYDSNGHDADNVKITDYLPQDLDFNSASGGGAYSSQYHTVTWQIGDINANDSNSVTLSVKVNECAEPNSVITNYCEIEGDNSFTTATADTNIGQWYPNSDIIYVNLNSPHPPGTGMSWRSAYVDLQDALARAKHGRGNEIWVAKGTYYPHNYTSVQDISFELVNGVDVYGGFAGYETSLNQQNCTDNQTILEGDVDDDSSSETYRIVKATNLSQETILDGFTIQHASYVGIKVDGSSLNVANCHIQNNGGVAYNRAGIYCTNSSVGISKCLIEDNNNCGIYIYSGPSLTITDSYIIDNGSTSNDGGGLYDNAVSSTITNCTFTGNLASYGGGIYNGGLGGNVAKISNCIFSDNKASHDGGGIDSGVLNSSSTIKNCIFFGNIAGDNGGGLFNEISSTTITNCTFSDNTATNYFGGGIYNTYSSSTLTNCIFWNNHASVGSQEICDQVCSPTFNYCDIQGGLPGPRCMGSSQGANNINSDPRFVDASGNNYHLYHLSDSDHSPCIDAGSPSGNYNGQTDLDGEDRLFDGDGDGTKRADIGADEYYRSPADYDGNGIVDLFDYAHFANAWRTENGDVNLDDNAYIDMLDLRLFSKDWLWQPAWQQSFSFGCGFCIGEGLSLQQQSATQTAGESVQPEQAQAELTELQAEPIELTPLDIDQMAEQLEDIWQQDDDLKEQITESQWQDFLDSLNPD